MSMGQEQGPTAIIPRVRHRAAPRIALGCKRIGIRCVDKGIPPHRWGSFEKCQPRHRYFPPNSSGCARPEIWEQVMTIAILIAAAASFAPIKQIDAGVLNIGYAELGPASGTPVILLHGWPYDIHSYEKVAPLLAGKGYHVIVPYLRGYGTTRFLSDATFRNGEQAAVALDVVTLMDALKIDKAILGGFDWG